MRIISHINIIMVVSFITNDHVFNKLAHYLFSSRSLVKEFIYWPTEIAAAILMFIYVYQMTIVPINLYNKEDRVQGWRIKYLPVDDVSRYTTTVDGTSYTLGYIDSRYYTSPGTVTSLSTFIEYPTDLINREYAWMCLCYFIKYFLYMCDTVYMVRKVDKFKAKSIDFFSSIMMGSLWLLWALYGWLNSYNQIHIGWVVKFAIGALKDQQFTSQASLDAVNAQITIYNKIYDQMVGWKWLYIPTVIIASLNLIVFLICVHRKRSSMYHGNSLATVFIPFQLFFLHLFLTGNWVTPNTHKNNGLSSEFKGYWQAFEVLFSDRYSARWVFWIIYLSAYVGLVIAVVCFVKGLYDYEKCKISGFKYISYSVFFVSAFVWVVSLDSILWGYYVTFRPAVGACHIICFICAGIICAISILQKYREGDRFIERHNRYDEWLDDAFIKELPPTYLTDGLKSGPPKYVYVQDLSYVEFKERNSKIAPLKKEEKKQDDKVMGNKDVNIINHDHQSKDNNEKTDKKEDMEKNDKIDKKDNNVKVEEDVNEVYL